MKIVAETCRFPRLTPNNLATTSEIMTYGRRARGCGSTKYIVSVTEGQTAAKSCGTITEISHDNSREHEPDVNGSTTVLPNSHKRDPYKSHSLCVIHQLIFGLGTLSYLTLDT
jgi:hypothetical protein